MKGLIWAAVMMAAVVAAGCRREVYSPVASMTSMADSSRVVSFHRDTLYALDSVRIERRGDTLVTERTRLVYRTAVRVDTVVSVVADTVRVTVAEPSKPASSRIPSALWVIIPFVAGLLASRRWTTTRG